MTSEVQRQNHWDELFKKVDYTQVLWHQNSPKKSLEFIQKYVGCDALIIDVGCGASLLVDNLLEAGYENITLLDTSITSLQTVKSRVNNTKIQYVNTDILNFQATQIFDVWHDRAVFHFLLTQKERKKYFEVLINSLKNDGLAIISTFRKDGPIQCAGLDIIQYDKETMLQELPEGLELTESQEYTHITPKESEQKYIYFVIKKV